MSAAKHSPAPWIRVPDQVGIYSGPLHKIVQLDGSDYHDGLVALAYGHHNDAGEYSLEANRALIVAAPELLKAARSVLAAFDINTPDWLRDEARALEAAVTKAEGRS